MRAEVMGIGLALAVLLIFSGMGLAQEVQTGSATLPEEIQTPSATLADVISAIQSGSHVAEKCIQVLSGFFTAAVEEGAITADQALELLKAIDWSDLARKDRSGFAVRALELALIALTTGNATYDEVLAELTEIAETGKLGALAAEERSANALAGLARALFKTGELTPELLSEIETAVAAGAPPGQVMRTVHALVRQGAGAGEIAAAVEELINSASNGPGARGPASGKNKGGSHGSSLAAKPHSGGGNGNTGDEDRGCPPGSHWKNWWSSGGGGCGGGDDEDEDNGHGHGHGRGKGKKG